MKSLKPAVRPLTAELGYINVRISKKAHRELLRRAIKDRRTLIKQLEVELGV